MPGWLTLSLLGVVRIWEPQGIQAPAKRAALRLSSSVHSLTVTFCIKPIFEYFDYKQSYLHFEANQEMLID